MPTNYRIIGLFTAVLLVGVAIVLYAVAIA